MEKVILPEPKPVSPVILTSILPFGKSEDGRRYRFSLCIDLKSRYADDEEPRPLTLWDFFRFYGAERNSIHSQITGAFAKVLITASGTSRAVDIMPWKEFSDCFKPETVSYYWGKVLPPKSTQGTAMIDEPGAFRRNLTVVPDNVTHFVSPEVDGDILRRWGIANISSSQKSAAQLQDQIRRELGKLDAHIEFVNQSLRGISTFSESLNERQADTFFKGMLEGRREERFSVQRIMDAFSFISSNILLQRFFGITIDFEVNAAELSGEFTMGLSTDSFLSIGQFQKNATKESETQNITWEHLTLPMEVLTAPGTSRTAIVVKRSSSAHKLIALNYDVGGKLKSLEQVRDRFNNICDRLKNATRESDRIMLKKELIKLDSSVFTRGLNLYDAAVVDKVKMCLEANPPAISGEDDKQVGAGDGKMAAATLTEENITRGNRYGVLSGGKIVSLGARKARVFDDVNKKEISVPDVFKHQEFAASADTGMHALTERNGQVKNEIILDAAILTWSGENIGMPGVFSNPEDDTNFEASLDEGSVSESLHITSKKFNEFFTERFMQKSVKYVNGGGRQQQQQQDLPDTEAGKELTIQYSTDKNAKLLFGRNHKTYFVPEYKNGWGPKFNSSEYELGFSEFKDDYKKDRICNFFFKRNEPVKPVTFYLQEPLLEDNKATSQHDGESLYHLVIRNYSSQDDSSVDDTRQTSVRYILPPPISFEHAFWHDKLFGMSSADSYQWYLKYHFPKTAGGTVTLKEAIDGSTMMAPFYPQECEINYLPDPLSKGFRFRFFKDKKCLIRAKEYEKYEQKEFYFSDIYPWMTPWKIILKDLDDDLNEKVDLITVREYREGGKDRKEIHILLEKGEEIFVVARTILDESYEQQMETYGNYNSFTRYGNNDILSPPLNFTLTHATQRPLVRPKFSNVIKNNKEQDKTEVALTVTLNVEQLGVYQDKAGITRYIEDDVPTGKIELYTKWEEFQDDPTHAALGDWTPEKPVNNVDLTRFRHNPGETPAALETSIDISTQGESMEKTLNRISSTRFEARNYATDLDVNYDVRETKFIEKSFWIKNKTKHTSYYPPDWGTVDDDITAPNEKKKSFFNRLSEKPFVVKILNNKKPKPPDLADRNIILVSVNEDSHKDNTIVRKTSMNRLRFYFNRGRLSSGKGERIGFILNEPKSVYNNELIQNGQISLVGRDIVTDSVKPYDGLYRNEQVLLTQSNFVINDPYDLRDENGDKTDDLESFSPLYVPELGLMTYLPKFDKKLNLWYLDVEFDINQSLGEELHNPFMQFGIVHYQENSYNYNDDAQTDLARDCRISDIFKSGFVYILPSRVLTCRHRNSSVEVSIGFDKASLADTLPRLNQPMDVVENPPYPPLTSIKKAVRSRFFAFIQSRSDSEKVRWIDTLKSDGKFAFAELSENNNYSMALPYVSDNSRVFRMVVIEVEDRVQKGDNPQFPLYEKSEDILENKNCRIVLVSTFDK
jgi:hypothetical protein